MACRLLIGAFGVAYVLALFLLAVSYFGLFGAARDPLGAVFVLPLGLPWNLLAGPLPEGVRAVAVILMPLVNLFILIAVCSRLGRR